MTFSTAAQQIDELGSTSVLVVLDPKTTRFVIKSPSLGHGRMTREIPDCDADVVNGVLKTFASGWDGRSNEPHEYDRERSAASSRVSRPTRQTALAQDRPRGHYYRNLGIALGVVDKQGLLALTENPAVAEIHHADLGSDQALSLCGGGLASNTAQTEVWGIRRMAAPALWARGFTGKGVLIAHMDTGVETTHAALSSAVGPYTVVDLHGRSSTARMPYTDCGTHGTHTGATIVGRAVFQHPRVGMAPDATLACATVLQAGHKVARLLKGLDWAVETGARILNLSVGFAGCNHIFTELINRLRQHQLLPIAAIGNAGPGKTRFPANNSNVLSVGAIDQEDRVPPWSGSAKPGSLAHGPSLCAPGSQVLSACTSGNYREESGTSMATAHISGLAALLLDACPKATVDQLENAIIASCENPRNENSDRIGAGIPSALTALDCLMAP